MFAMVTVVWNNEKNVAICLLKAPHTGEAVFFTSVNMLPTKPASSGGPGGFQLRPTMAFS